MTQEAYALQAHGIGLRLVQNVAQLQLAGIPVPIGGGVGPQVLMLGKNFVPCWRGINGPRGFSEGYFFPRLYEEGEFQLTFPNAEGEDGVLHRRRFLITQAGRVTPTGGNVTTYQGGAFRPGDEFVEIYRLGAPGAPGKLLFVCAVTKATLDGASLTLEGNDALWLLKKNRESSAGVYFNAPRDVCEHFTRVKQVIAADDFADGGATGRFNYVSGAYQTTSDSQWQYDHAWNVPPTTNSASPWSYALQGMIRMSGAIRTQTLFPISFLQQADCWARVEAKVRMLGPMMVRIGFGVGDDGSTATPATWGPVLTLDGTTSPPGQTTLQFGTLPQEKTTFQLTNFSSSAWHTLAVEARDRYIFAYVDGKLVGVLPQFGAVDNFFGAVATGAQAFVRAVPSAAGGSAVDVGYAVVRVLSPGMLRPASASNLGDYAIGGLPVGGSCSLEVWRIDDMVRGSPQGSQSGAEFSPSRLGSQFTGKFPASTLSLGSAQANGTPGWWPQGAGVWYGGGFACRASGSIYLTLGSYDYRFRSLCDDGSRLWVAKTRFGEQLIDNWRTDTQLGHAPALFTTPYLKNAAGIGATTVGVGGAAAGGNSVPLSSIPTGCLPGQLVRIGNAFPSYDYGYISGISGSTITLRDNLQRTHAANEQVIVLNQGALSGLGTGWYPFIFEFYNNPAGGGFNPGQATLQYERSDQPGWWNNVGSSAYLHEVYAIAQQYGASGYYWPLALGLSQAAVVGGQQYPEYLHGGTASITATDNLAISTTQACYAPGDSAPLLNGGIVSGRTGDYLNAGNVPISTSGWTISAEIRCDIANSTQQEVFRKENALLLRVNANNQIEVLGHNGTAFEGPNAGTAVTAGTWYHVVATWDGSTIRLYVNGSLVNSAAHAAQVTNSNNAYLGSLSGTSEWFNGAFNHVLLLPSAMSAADVATLYAAASSPPHVPMSESGIVDSTQQPYRYVSHYDQLLQTVKDWGLQIKTEPMQLESGEFPGRLRPLVRVGRDTEYKVGSPQVRLPTASDLQDSITAEEVCDALVADAQGLADPNGTSQIAAEIFDFAEIFGMTPGGNRAVMLHPLLSEEYDQSNDVSYPDLLEQRLFAQLLLRGSPWEEVSMSHRPTRQTVDTFPLTGSPQEFNWEPGDGVRLDLPELGIEDASCRQILGVQWPITPSGLGAPAISLRQRPRNFAQVLRDIITGQRTSQRAYQGQFVSATGTPGGAGTGVTGVVDATTRIPLPNKLSSISRALLVVLTKSDTSTWQTSVNGSTAGAPTFTTPGVFDITALVGRLGNAPYMTASASGGTGTATYVLQLLHTATS